MKVSGFAENLDKSLYSHPEGYVADTSLHKAKYLLHDLANEDVIEYFPFSLFIDIYYFF